MPTYEYKCKNCSYEFEEMQSMNAEPLIHCPECNTPNLLRGIGGGSGMIFKGSGFYLTDYKSGGSTEKKSSISPKAETKTSSSSKTE